MAKTKYACEILGQSFETAEALRQHCRSIIDAYLSPEMGDEREMSDEHSSFFVELVRLRDPGRIPNRTYVRRVVRCCRLGQRGRHVRFEFGDGTSDLIGWAKICGGKPATFNQVTNAMREAIRDQMQSAYMNFFQGRVSGVCPRTGMSISYTGEHHGDSAVVHHDGMSFSQIRDMWFAESGLAPAELVLKDLFDGGGYTLADGEARDSWRAFHAQNATLVVVSASWHRDHHAADARTIEEHVA